MLLKKLVNLAHCSCKSNKLQKSWKAVVLKNFALLLCCKLYACCDLVDFGDFGISVLFFCTCTYYTYCYCEAFYCLVSLKHWLLFHRNIEDILAERGDSVKRLSESDSLEFLVQDLVDKIEKDKQVDDDKEKP